MSVYSGPEISNDGLVLSLDAANPKSYNPNLVTTLGAYNYSFNNQILSTSLDIAPDGTSVLCKHDLTGATSPFMNVRVNRTLPVGTYTISAWVKGTTSFSGAFSYIGETPGSSGAAATTISVIPSWQRFSHTFNITTTQTAGRIQIFFGSEGNNKIISVWGVELVAGSAPTKNYIDSNKRGDVLYDSSGNAAAYQMALTNCPAFVNTGAIQFNGTNQYGSLTTLNYSTSTFTIIAASRYSGSTRGRVISSMANNWLFGHWGSGSEEYYAQGWINAGTPNDTNWRIYCATENYSTDQRSFYVNGISRVVNSTAGSQGFNGLSLGRWGSSSGSEYSTCEISFIQVYNRILSYQEIQQSFNALRGRFGI